MFTKEDLKQRTVAVLLGGKSAEREVSLKTGTAVADALEARGYDVARIDVGDDVAERLTEAGPAAAFIALHGRWGEDGCIQGLLECLGVPYTGAGVLASAMAMDKVASKHLFTSAGLSTPAYLVVPRERAPSVEVAEVSFGLPLVVKPAREGSSVGITIVKEEAAFGEAMELAASYAGDVLVEKFVSETTWATVGWTSSVRYLRLWWMVGRTSSTMPSVSTLTCGSAIAWNWATSTSKSCT